MEHHEYALAVFIMQIRMLAFCCMFFMLYIYVETHLCIAGDAVAGGCPMEQEKNQTQLRDRLTS